MYLKEATKSGEEGSVRHWRHFVHVHINRRLYAMGGLHLFYSPFLGNGPLSTGPAALYAWKRVLPSLDTKSCELSCNEAWLRCILRGKD